jgi:hypothetical protein
MEIGILFMGSLGSNKRQASSGRSGKGSLFNVSLRFPFPSRPVRFQRGGAGSGARSPSCNTLLACLSLMRTGPVTTSSVLQGFQQIMTLTRIVGFCCRAVLFMSPKDPSSRKATVLTVKPLRGFFLT